MNNKILIIKSTILEINKPFLISELFTELEKKGIHNKILILGVLDQMLDEGLVSYDDFKEDSPVYKTFLITARA